jgi:hypothetical protein
MGYCMDIDHVTYNIPWHTVRQQKNIHSPMEKPTDAVYQRMLYAWKVKTYVALAPCLEVSVGAVRQNKSEGTVPEAYILRTLIGTTCRKQWLLTGEEPIYRGDLLVADLTAPLQRAVRIMMGASEEAQAVFERVAGLLASGQRIVIDAIVNGAMAAEQRRRIVEEMEHDVPGDASPSPTD